MSQGRTTIEKKEASGAVAELDLQPPRGTRDFYLGSGPTANDEATFPYDTDSGFNERQNFPVLASAETNGATTRITGRLRSTRSTPFHLEFFSSAVCDPRGFGEGERFRGALEGDTNAVGEFSFDTILPTAIPPTYGAVTATATRLVARRVTSEFSTCIVPVPELDPRFTGLASVWVLVLARRRLAGRRSSRGRSHRSSSSPHWSNAMGLEPRPSQPASTKLCGSIPSVTRPISA